MKNIHVIGISHQTAPIEIREKFYLTATEQDLFLSELKSHPAVLEAFVMSTCNRTEVFLRVLEGFDPFNDIFDLLVGIKAIKAHQSLFKLFYCFRDRLAVRHLFSLATGMESLILGERQILGQLKAAIERAQKRGMFGKNFNILTNVAIRTGKKAQTETDISFGGLSVSWAALAKAGKEIGDLSDKEILVIGAGKMSKLTVGGLRHRKFKKLYLMNRTQAKAKDLADKMEGEAVGFCDIKEILSKVDVGICASSAPHYILDKETVEKILPARQNRRLLLIDISIPRNIDPLIAQLPSIDLYEIDDLKEVVDQNKQRRKNAVKEVKEIIDSKLAEFYEKITAPSFQALANGD